MKFIYLFFISISLITVSLQGNSPQKMDIQTVRQKYIKAVSSQKEAEELLVTLNSIVSNNNDVPLYLAYQGAILGLMAKHAYNPFTKLDYLNQSKKVLAKAIDSAPTEPELRFLRFCMEHYLPPVLGYSSNLSNDRIMIVKHIEKTDGDVRKVITSFLLESKRCTPTEIQKIKSL